MTVFMKGLAQLAVKTALEKCCTLPRWWGQLWGLSQPPSPAQEGETVPGFNTGHLSEANPQMPHGLLIGPAANRSVLVPHHNVVFTTGIMNFHIPVSQSMELLLCPGLSVACVHDVLLSPLQQAVVGLDLLLQAAFDVQEGLVFLVLALHFRSYFSQPLLHAGDLALELGQVFVVATFGFRQRGFQVFFLRMETTRRNLGVLRAQPVWLQARLWGELGAQRCES